MRALARQKQATTLFVLEVALSLAVGVHAYLLGARFDHMIPESVGSDEAHVLLATVELEAGDFDSLAFRASVVRRDLDAARSVPGVVAAAEADEIALNRTHVETITPEGSPDRDREAWILDDRGGVADALGLSLLAGRALTAADVDATDASPVVVTAGLARRLFPDGDALGRPLHRSLEPRPLRIVGVVASFPAVADASRNADSVLLIPTRAWLGRTLSYLIRVAGPAPSDALPVIADALERQEPARGVHVRGLAEGASLQRRTNSAARGAALFLSGLMLLLVLLGRVGMSSFLVAERRNQIGLRRALGATRGDVMRWFLVENALLTTAGIALGLAFIVALNRAALALAPHMQLRLDPATIVVACAIFWLTGLLTALITARRAAAVEPGEATRS